MRGSASSSQRVGRNGEAYCAVPRRVTPSANPPYDLLNGAARSPASRVSLRHAAVTASRTALAMRSRFGKTWDSSTGV